MKTPPALHPFLPRIVGSSESEFRRSRIEWERRELVALFAILCLTLPLGFVNDVALVATDSSRLLVQSVRGIAALMAAATVVAALRTSTERTRDAVAAVTIVFLIALELTNATHRPVDYIGFVPTTVVGILVIFISIPIPFLLKSALLFVEATGIIWIMWTMKEVGVPALRTATLAVVAAVVIGAWVAVRLGRSSRTQYLTLERERRARLDLESAHAEIARLEGILPICSSCKRIRDDDGFWQQIEVFVEAHSDAQFSHGTCPACMRELYPGVLSTDA